MPTATTTIDTLIQQHTANLAYVAEMTTPATDPAEFTRHLDYTADNFDLAGLSGVEDLRTAGTLLVEAAEADGAAREAFLARVAALLKDVPDMTAEYRNMVGD